MKRSIVATKTTKTFSAIALAFALVGCSGGNDASTALAGKSPDTITPAPAAACSSSKTQCADGTLTTCEDGATKTVSCEEQCKADGFEPSNACSSDGTRCGCSKPTDTACYDGLIATCTCLDTSPACQTSELRANYIHCHREPSSETATILACFKGYKSGDQVECNAAITHCGSSTGQDGCTADADCGQCERCELSTGKCLTKAVCN